MSATIQGGKEQPIHYMSRCPYTTSRGIHACRIKAAIPMALSFAVKAAPATPLKKCEIPNPMTVAPAIMPRRVRILQARVRVRGEADIVALSSLSWARVRVRGEADIAEARGFPN